MRWHQEELPNYVSGVLERPQTPQEQFDDILLRWNSGKPLRYNRALKDLTPVEKEVWEMKTADIRVFGWLYRPKQFMAAFAGYADDYKRQEGKPPKESYDEARDRVVAIRDRIDLDPPKFTTGKYDELV